MWAARFAVTADETGLTVCLICNEKLANNKKLNEARHFQNKHAAFAKKYPVGEDRKKVVSELMRKADLSKNHFRQQTLKMLLVRRPILLRITNAVILKISSNRTNLCSKHGMLLPTFIGT